ncbi:MAG: hypothetical protein F4X76_09960 [Chloroflexi bacterium]|nr:hypothetical protein [Chloroflexota bacterium]
MLAAAKWAAGVRPARDPLVGTGTYGRATQDRLTTSARTVVDWLSLTWQRVDIEKLPKIGPEDYPTRLAALHFQAGIAKLESQNSEAAIIDNKLAVAGGAALAGAALILAALSLFGSAQELGDAEIGLLIAGATALCFAFLNSVRGLWPRTYRDLPSLGDIRRLAATDATDDDVHWSISVSIEQAVGVNERVMKARVATVKLTYSSMMAGAVLVLAAFAAHLGP